MSAVHSPPRATPGSVLLGPPPARRRRAPWSLALAALLVGAFVLRVWGVDHGMPYAYNADENAHFLTRAIGLFGHDLDPRYFVNPPAYTYLLHGVFALWFGGRRAVGDAFAADPAQLWVLARLVTAALGTLAVGLLALAGARLFDRRVGLLAAALLAVAFLPVFYSHLALNDVPTLAPLCLALWGIAGVLRRGRAVDFAVAGLGLGLACATKYTAGIVLLCLLAAAPLGPARRWGLPGLLAAGALAVAAFVAANPYAVLDAEAFLDGLGHQSEASGDAAGKLGLTQASGLAYYLWSLGWGLGWVPLAAAALAVALLWRGERRALAVLVPAPVAYVLFMGLQERYFGRWLMPVLPLLALLAAAGALALADRAGRRVPRLRPALVALGALALLAQGLVHSVHVDRVLARPDTRQTTRAWLVGHVPPGTRIVVEPVVPDGWAQDVGRPERRWQKFPTSRSRIDPDTGRLLPPPGQVVNIEDFERVLRPGLVGEYERGGYCWVVVGSTQRGRAEADPGAAPGALAYYRELERRAERVWVDSPYRPGARPVPFNFDWSFDFYPLAYARPGPLMEVFRLRGGRCGET